MISLNFDFQIQCNHKLNAVEQPLSYDETGLVLFKKMSFEFSINYYLQLIKYLYKTLVIGYMARSG